MDEGPRQHHAFQVYWEGGAQRSFKRLQQLLAEDGNPASKRAIANWSKTFHWQRRLAEYDRLAVVAKEEEERIKQIREMKGRHAVSAMRLQQWGHQQLSELDIDEVKAADAIRSVVEGQRLEQLARGEATERIAHQKSDNDQLTGVTDAELEDILSSIRAAQRASHRALWREQSRRNPDDPWAFAMAHSSGHDGELIVDLPALASLARDRHPLVVVQKSAQVGLTQLTVNRALWAADTAYAGRGNVIVFMPTQGQMDDFSQSHFDRTIRGVYR